jgi:IS5 family transposase
MVERNVGQMSLADGLIQAPRSSILDEIEAVVDWAPLRSLLGKRLARGLIAFQSGPDDLMSRFCPAAGTWRRLIADEVISS